MSVHIHMHQSAHSRGNTQTMTTNHSSFDQHNFLFLLLLLTILFPFIFLCSLSFLFPLFPCLVSRLVSVDFKCPLCRNLSPTDSTSRKATLAHSHSLSHTYSLARRLFFSLFSPVRVCTGLNLLLLLTASRRTRISVCVS